MGTDDNNGRVGLPLKLGQVVITPGALTVLEEAGETELPYLARHHSGDWGEVDHDDWQENELSLREGFRIFSSYTTSTGVKLWIITEADRSATTILLPSEY